MTAADLFGPGLFGPVWISSWLVGAALVVLAVWLYVLDLSSSAQRTFAVLLFLRGLTFFLGPLRSEAEGAEASALWANLAPYAILPLVPLVIAFLSLYPRRRGLARFPWGMPLLLAVSLALEIWYFLDHAAYATVVPGQPAQYTAYGPLFLFLGLRLPLFAFAGFVLAGDYLRNPKGSIGFSLFLMVTAFTLNGIYDGTLAVSELVRALRDPATDWSGWTWTRWWLPVLTLPIAGAAAFRMVPVLRRSRTDPELQEIVRFFIIGIPVAVVSAFVRELPSEQADYLAQFVLAIWRLSIPLLVTYALLRYQLFDIDIKLKDGVRRGIIVASFTVTFFLVSEAAESLVQGDRGPIFGIVAAGFLALASRPVQRFAERTSNAFMPDTKPIAEQSYAERTAFYLEQYRLITTDGQVTPKERKMLGRLQTALSLSDDAVHDIETMGVVDHPEEARLTNPMPNPVRAETKDSRLEIAVKTTLVAGAMALFFGMLSQGIESVIPLSGTLAGLLSAAFVALLIGPLENLADRVTHRLDPQAATEERDRKERLRAFEAALVTALEDGSLSPRDLDYLNHLQGRLGIPRTTRWRLERKAQLAVARMAPRAV